MVYLLTNFWIWFLAALLIGLVVGAVTFKGYQDGFFKSLIPWGIVLGGGTLIASLRILPNGPGLWLDLAVLMSMSYFIGCLIGYLWRLCGCQRGTPSTLPAASIPAPTIPAPVMPSPAKDLAVEPAKTPVAEAQSPASEEAITGLSAPRGGTGDDLTQIYGIDAETEKKLNGLGIYHYDQLAGMNPAQRRWLFGKLGYEGRFPSWWWRWRHDAEQLRTGKSAVVSAPVGVISATAPSVSAGGAASAAADEVHEGVKPTALAGPRGGKADDLKRIRGIGKQNEGRLHALGVWHFDQVALWSNDEAKWVGSYLAFPGRIEREEWISQAKILAAGGVTDFAKRVDKGEVASSRDDTHDDGQSNVAKLDKPVTKPPAK